MNLYLDPNGVGERHEITKGAIFGESHFRLALRVLGSCPVMPVHTSCALRSLFPGG